MNAYQNKNIFPAARHNYCHNIKPQVYVHVFTSISVLQHKHNFTNCSWDPAASTNRMIFTETKIVVHFYKKFQDIIIIFYDFPGLSMKSGHPVIITHYLSESNTDG